MDISKIYALFNKYKSVSIDTRSIKPNDIFFAIKGPNFDGNNFALQAIKTGASYVISDNPDISKKSDKIIYVENSIKALQKLANYHRRKLNTKIIAITGSNGKTTSKELILNVLKTKYKTTATKGNLNNHLGVPLSLLEINENTEFGIIEMGANHLNEIAQLCKIAEPSFGYITNFGNAHLEGFGSIEGVIKGKSELYNFLKNNKSLIFYNSENIIQTSLINNYKNTYTFGINSKSKCIINKSKSENTLNVSYQNKIIKSTIYGDYNFENICIAIAIGEYFEVDFKNIKKGIESYIPKNNRSQISLKNNNTIILDAYNANPTSMSLALESFKKTNYKNKMIILGDMFELGKDSNYYHQEITNSLEKINDSTIYIVGEYFFNTKHSDRIRSFSSSKELINNLSKTNVSNYSILIKGSRGMQLEKIIEFI
ncbi:MAG: UDP-N-acetylmuramoyl-tripeptide--D-alanyl-D-alanine ligase [Flavobacteriaceae bacterium]|nr:UDP-N-acetylmuramoyl-tripeptide--D-alanyl-D-alanine ligase [Flavobacteriaceae bacterium]